MTQEPQSMFQVGDVVRVVATPYTDCPLTWVSDMDYYCGREATISGATYDKNRKHWAYSLKGIPWSWCENCFEPPIADIEESDEDISTLFI